MELDDNLLFISRPFIIMSKRKGRELVYSLLKKVPKNKVTTYAELARVAGTHPRAVAVFMLTNKDPAKIPCFRVVRSDGEIGGYSAPGGAKKKIELLKMNGIEIAKGKINMKKYLHRF